MTATLDLTTWSLDDLAAAIEHARVEGDTLALTALLAALEREASRWDPLPYQRPPLDDWYLWLLLAGRGTGKTDSCAAYMDAHAKGPPCDTRVKGGHRMGIVAPTFGDGVDACVEGPSGLLAHNPDVRLVTQRGITYVVWPNGARARIFGAFTDEDTQRLRAGGNRCLDWWEEFATWRQLTGAIDNATFGLRLGNAPRIVASTTPKNRAELRALLQKAGAYSLVRALRAFGLPADVTDRSMRVRVTRASTRDNVHLAPEIRAALYATYGATRLGRQELDGELLDDLGTYFTRGWFGTRDVVTSFPLKVRAWDFATSPPGPGNEDPDWTVGALTAFRPDGTTLVVDDEPIMVGEFVIEDIVRMRDTPGQVEQSVVATARADGPDVVVLIEQEHGSAGKHVLAHYQRLLQGIARVLPASPTGSKEVRASIVSTAAEQGRLSVVRAPWNGPFFDEAEEFPNGAHDDQVDAVAYGVAYLSRAGRPAEVSSAANVRLPAVAYGSNTRPTFH